MNKARTKFRGIGMTRTVAAVAACLLLSAFPVQAADVILDNNDNVTQVLNLDLDFDRDELDGLYNVEFFNGTGEDIYGSEDNFDFPLAEDASTAIIQLNNALNLNNPVPTGASSAGTRQYYIPAIEYFGLWAAFGGEYFPAVNGWDACEFDCLSGIGVLQPDATLTYARFTPSDGEPPPPPPEPEADDRFIDVVTLGDVGGSGDVDLAVLDVELDGGVQLSAKVHVRDGGTGNEIYQTTLKNDFNSLAIETLVGNSGPLLAVLQRKSNGTIRVHVLDANDGTVAGNYQYHEPDWTPIDILSVSDAGGPGIAGIGVLASSPDGQIAIQTRKAGNGNIVETVFFLGETWDATAAIDLGEFNGNGRSELSVLATNAAGKHAVETRDALTAKQISKQFFLSPDNTVIGLADVADLNSSDRPEVVVLGNKPANNNTANTIQAKDVKSGELINKIGTYGPDFIGFGIRSIGDVDGNSGEEVVVAVLKTTDNSTSVSVRDVGANTLTKKTGFLGPAYTPQDVEVLDDVSGNSIQEVIVGGVRSDNLAARVQLRDALTGAVLRNIDLN